jgi:hypothetical protein
MRDFLGHVTPRYELALQQNEVLDIFEDEFANLADDEGGTGSSKRNSAITVSARGNGWVKGTLGLEDVFQDEFANLADDEGGMRKRGHGKSAC